MVVRLELGEKSDPKRRKTYYLQSGNVKVCEPEVGNILVWMRRQYASVDVRIWFFLCFV
jgi:hypothetical protein